MLRMLTGFAIGVVVTSLAVLGTILASGGQDEVRVVARLLEDGRVEVGVQQRAADGWTARQLPELRFLSPDSPVSQWRSSSAVHLVSAESVSDSQQPVTEPEQASQPESPAAAAARVSTVENPDFYCLVTHEQPGDEAFWNLVRQGAKRYAETSTVLHRVVGAPTVDAQADLVRECVADGAAGISVTLADPDGMEAAIQHARAAGVVVHSFNSGGEDFRRVGSARHVAVDELRAGHTAASLFAENGVNGRLLCVVHEERNVGLNERCDGLAERHGGEVERLSVAATGVADLAGSTARIEARLADPEAPQVAGVLALNSQVALAARDAIATAGGETALATFDQSTAVMQAILDGEILFAIDTVPWHQAWYAMSSLTADVYAIRILVDLYDLEDPYRIIPNVGVRIEPEIFTTENARDWLEVIDLINQINVGG